MTSYCTQTTKVVTKNDCCSPSMRSDKYYVTISVADTWIMPAVNAQTILQIPNCNNLLPGSWLWNGNVGYLRIDSYNSASGEVKVTNIGYTGNAAPDTVFPSCMDFVVTAPILVDEISDNVTCLTSDFVSPTVGNCALMTVKSTANLRKDYIIAIDIYQYQVSEVMDNTTVKVCNYGLGKVGVIDAPCDGSCLPIRVINAESPCLQDAVNEANGLVSCVGGETKVFVGLEEGQSAYWSNVDGSWKLINSNIEADCTVTTNTVNLIAGNVGPYLLNVVTTAPFKVGDRLTFNNEHDAYVVSEIVNELQLRVIKNEAPIEDTIIDAETRLCIVDCCDWIPEYIGSLANRLDSVEIVNVIQAQQINSINEAIEDLQITKMDKTSLGDLLATPSELLTVTDGEYCLVGHDATITLNTDLSQYDNSVSGFITLNDIPAIPNSLDDLSDVSIDSNTLASGNYLSYNGTSWVNSTFPTITTVNDATLTIQKNSNTVGTFTANASTNATIDIPVPTDTSDLSNGAGFITSASLPTMGVINSDTTISSTDINLNVSSNSTSLTGQFTISDSNAGTTNIIGTVVVAVKARVFNDTHYYTPSGSGYAMVTNAYNCELKTVADVKVGTTTVRSSVTMDEEYYFVPDPQSGSTATHSSVGTTTQFLTIPFAISLASLPANTQISIPITISCPNAANKTGSDNDEKVRAVVKNVRAYVSALIYKL